MCLVTVVKSFLESEASCRQRPPGSTRRSSDCFLSSFMNTLYFPSNSSAVEKMANGRYFFNRFLLLIGFLPPLARPWKVLALETLKLVVGIDDILVSAILVVSSLFTSAGVSMIDAIVTPSRSTESIIFSDSDDTENFVNDRKAWSAGSFVKCLFTPLICYRDTGMSTTLSWHILLKSAIFQYESPRQWKRTSAQMRSFQVTPFCDFLFSKCFLWKSSPRVWPLVAHIAENPGTAKNESLTVRSLVLIELLQVFLNSLW